MVTRINKFDEDAVPLQLQSIKEVEEVLACAENKSESPFLTIERWMEEIGAPPRPQCVRMSGVPLHAWREGVFRLLGDYLGADTGGGSQDLFEGDHYSWES